MPTFSDVFENGFHARNNISRVTSARLKSHHPYSIIHSIYYILANYVHTFVAFCGAYGLYKKRNWSSQLHGFAVDFPNDMV